MKKTLLILCTSLMLNGLVLASGTVTWTGSGIDNLWTNSSNWDNEPNNPDLAIIDATGTDPLVNMIVPDTYANIRFGYNNLNLVGLTMTGGSLGTDTAKGYIGFDGNTYCNLSGGTIAVYEVLFGKTGAFALDITGGAIHVGRRVTLGEIAGHGGGTATMSGGEIISTFGSSYLSLGHAAGGLVTFDMSDGFIRVNALPIGLRGNAVFNMTGGYISLFSHVRVGENVGIGTWNLDAGQIDAANYVTVGFGVSTGTNVINMTGGVINTGDFTIGRYSNGIVNLYGGTININYYDKAPADLLLFDTNGGDGLLNLCGGTFNWMNGDFIANVEASIQSGDIVAYNGSGRILYYLDGYDTVIKADDTAHDPIPGVDALVVDPRSDMTEWQLPFPGQTVYCDVYFGTSSDITTNAKIVDYQSVTSASVTLTPQTTYYWRVDTYNPVTSVKTEGVVWSFTSNALGSQMPITPQNGAVDVLRSQVFSWDMFGSFETVNIYVGSDSPENMILVATQPASYKDYHYDGLEYGKDYYWRVDSVDGSFVQEGVVWTFTTITPVCQIDINYGDLNNDCKVNLGDFAVMASNWLACGWDISEACE